MAQSRANMHFHQGPAGAPQAALPQYGSCTDIGMVRDHNEDSLLVRPPLFVVADGMGGHAAGEVASEIAVQVIANQAPRTLDSDALGRAVESANAAILRAATEGRGREGMGTTVTAALVAGERIVLAQVGDSRAYLLHNGHLQQLTRDHSLMADLIEAGQITPEEAKCHPQRSVITRALGVYPYTRPDLYELNVCAGDRLLLCSDGLSGMVSDSDIEITLNCIANPQLCANRLISQAKSGGGQDNITAIVVDIAGFTEAHARTSARKSKRMLGLIVALAVVILAGCGFGLHHYVSHSAFLADENGYVAIYQGLPDTFLGASLGTLEEVSNIPTAQLSPGTADRLKTEGIKVNSMKEARTLIEEYRAEIAENARTAAALAAQAGQVGQAGQNAASAGTAAANNPGAGTAGTGGIGGTGASQKPAL